MTPTDTLMVITPVDNLEGGLQLNLLSIFFSLNLYLWKSYNEIVSSETLTAGISSLKNKQTNF